MQQDGAKPCNISDSEISKRRWIGVAAVVACLALETAFVVTDASRLWRLALFPFLYIGISGILQAHEKT